MESLLFLAWLMFAHFYADFCLQSREMGRDKSIHFSVLLHHLVIQFVVIFAAVFIGLFAAGFFSVMFFHLSVPTALLIALKFSIANALVHGLIDWNIWRGYKNNVKSIIIKEMKLEYKLTHGEETWQGDDSFINNDEFKARASNWKFWEDHKFFMTIGLDQLLHTLTLIILVLVFL